MKSADDALSMAERGGQRIDTWLWASRFFRSRRLANEAVRGGHVWLNGQRCKPARTVAPGDRLRIRRLSVEFTVVVAGLSARRLGAPLAAGLYRETEASLEARQNKAALMKAQRQGILHDRHRPGKRERGKMLRVKRQLPDWD